jgi:hypothetical protein
MESNIKRFVMIAALLSLTITSGCALYSSDSLLRQMDETSQGA